MRLVRLVVACLSLGAALVAASPAFAVATLSDLTLAPATVAPGGTSTGTVTLSEAAPPGGTPVTLSAAPGVAASVPAQVNVPMGETQAQFQITTGAASGMETISATLGGVTISKSLTVGGTAALHPVINEVDYDQPGPDTASFIEIFNPSCTDVDLTNLAVVLVDGANNTEYARIPLSGAGASLPGGEYVVIGNSSVSVPNGTLFISEGATDFIQNGAPDGIALVDTAGQTLIDALSYEGSITAASITGFPGTYDLVEGTPTTAADSTTTTESLARNPNGSDTNDANTDWSIATTPTPGEPRGSCGNHAPVFAPIGDRNVVAGQTLSFAVSATDSDGDALTYSASNLPSGATFDSATRTFSWTPSALQAGMYSGIHFSVTDGQAIRSQDITITVTSPSVTDGGGGLPSQSSGDQTAGPGGSAPAPPVSPATVARLDTKILRIKVKKRTATATFSGTGGKTFECKLDRGRFTACRSPKVYKELKPGKHTLLVRVKSAAGKADPTPATQKFLVKQR